MPIKFRCQQCRQFLGISRSQAESVVDCPTCGRTIRVPALDGTIRPLPKPGLDPQDSKLTAALDELASIGEMEGGAGAPEDAGPEEAVAAVHADDRKPSPLLREYVVIGADGKPVDLDVLPERCDFEPVKSPARKADQSRDEMSESDVSSVGASGPEASRQSLLSQPVESGQLRKDSSRQNRPWAETAQPGESWQKLLAAAGGQSDAGMLPSGTGVPAAAEGPSEEAAARLPRQHQTDTERSQRSTRVPLGLWFVLTGVAAVLFAVGFWRGRVTTGHSPPDSSPGQQSETRADNRDQADSGDTDPAGELSEPGKVALRGRITYQSEGQRKPDHGASVIVLPGNWTGLVKLPAGGFRSELASDRRVATASLQAMGGNFALADEQGEFEITLPSSGHFFVLVLSNALVRADTADETTVEETIARYFDRPAQLLGRLRCYLEEVRWSGDAPEPWDYSFRD